jgi:L-asparagine transporter-like permease
MNVKFLFQVSGILIEFQLCPSVIINVTLLKHAFDLTTPNYASAAMQQYIPLCVSSIGFRHTQSDVTKTSPMHIYVTHIGA